MNEKLKQAYERLGLSETVTGEELNKRFDLLLRRRRSLRTETEIAAYEEEFQAIKLILDSRDQQEIQEAEDQRLAKYGSLAGGARKWERFMRLYKTHVIIGIIAVIVLIAGGNALYNNWQHRKYLASLPPIDAKIMFIGNFGVKDPNGKMDDLNKAILAEYPQWKRVDSSIVYLPKTGAGADTLDMNYMQKAVVELAANSPDILVLDEATLEWIGGQDGFQNLEPILKDGKISSSDARLKWGTDGESGQKELYAVDITDSKFVSTLPINRNTQSVEIGVLGGEEQKVKMFDFVKHVAEEAAGK